MTKRACLIGHPVAHSRSPAIHGFWLKTLGIDGSYELVDLTGDALAVFAAELRAGTYLGCNVTVPHKEAIVPLLDHLDETAKAVGAVNTIWREGEALIGGNTDVYGFLTNLDEGAPGWDQGRRVALVLGAGGRRGRPASASSSAASPSHSSIARSTVPRVLHATSALRSARIEKSIPANFSRPAICSSTRLRSG